LWEKTRKFCVFVAKFSHFYKIRQITGLLITGLDWNPKICLYAQAGQL